MNNQSTTGALKLLLLAPGQPNPLYGYPPYSSSKKNTAGALRSWRRASAAVSEVVVEVKPDGEKALIDEWVEQLIRIELGSALPADVTLKIDLPIDVIWVIQGALERRARESERC